MSDHRKSSRSHALPRAEILHKLLELDYCRAMASRVAATAAKAIYAEPAFVPKGPINAGRFNLIREIAIGFTLGLTGGMMWKVGKMCLGCPASWAALLSLWRGNRGRVCLVVHQSRHCTGPGVQPAAAGTHTRVAAVAVPTPPPRRTDRNALLPPLLLLQMWHWGEKRRLAQYYSELYAREKAEEDAYTEELRSKLKALEEELLA